MHRLNSMYAQHFNRTHGRVGHVFQDRYKAILVEKDAYLLELARYVVLNPVRAGITEDPADWPWSSYGATCGDVPSPPWLETGWLLRQFGNGQSDATQAYKRFVEAGRKRESVRTGLRNDLYLGSEQFAERMQGLVRPEDQRGVARWQLRPVTKPLS